MGSSVWAPGAGVGQAVKPLRDEERLRLLESAVLTANDAVIIADADPIHAPNGPRIVFVNDAFTRMTGYTPEEVVSKTPRILQGPKTDRDELDRLRNALRVWKPVRVELVNYRKDGSEFWVELVLTPVADETGWYTHWVSVQRDVTQRKQVEGLLRDGYSELEARVQERTAELLRANQALEADIAHREQAEQRLRLLESVIVHANDAVLISDARGLDSPEGPRILYVNAAFTRLTGYTAEEVIGLTPRLLQGPKTDRRQLDRIRQALEAAQPIKIELINYHKSGRDYWTELAVAPIQNAQGVVTHFVSISRDITDRKLAEEQICEQAALLDQARDAILVRDLGGKVRFWNKGAERLYGWTAAEALGRPAADLLGYGDSPAPDADGGWNREVRQTTRSGKALVVESRGSLLCGEDGRPKAVLVINTDVSERKKLEVQFLRAQRLESLGTLAGGIAHDLNNMLTPIVMCAPLLQMNLPEAERQALITNIQISAERGAEVVKQVLSFARGIEGRHTPLHLGPLLADLEKMLRRTFPKSIVLECKIEPGVWSVVGDRTQLFQTLMNLCVNARDAMPDGGLLTLAACNRLLDEEFARGHVEAHTGPYVLVEVADTGSGIPPEVFDKIFDPFFTTKEVGKGTGLGLSTALGIVKSHGGFLDVVSDVGRGTSFSLYLPAAPSGEASVASVKPVLPQGKGELVLVVDDEPGVRQIAHLTLETNGYRTVQAPDGAEALAVFLQNREDVRMVLLDMMMPVLDGPATVRALRRLAPKLRIVGVSGLTPAGMPEDLDGVPVEEFICKPYTAEQLLTAVRRVLDDAPAADGS